MISFLLSFFLLAVQSEMNLDNSTYCYDYLYKHKEQLQADSINTEGIRLEVTQELLKNDCDFQGELIFAVMYFYGQPDKVLVWNEQWATEDAAITYKYKLRTTQDGVESANGDKELIINCTNDYRITKFFIFTVDE